MAGENFDDYENPYAAPKANLRGDDDAFGPGAAAGGTIRWDVIGESWELLKQEMGPWAIMILISGLCWLGVYLAVNLLPLAVLDPEDPTVGQISLLGTPLVWAVQVFFEASLFRTACKQVRGERIEVGDLFDVGGRFWPAFGAVLLVGILSGLGFLLCIIPGFLVAGRLMLTIPLVADGRLGVGEAINTSWNAFRGKMVDAALFYFVIGLLAGVGILLCGVGFLFTKPLFYLAIALVYRDFFPGAFAVVKSPYGPGGGDRGLAMD